VERGEVWWAFIGERRPVVLLSGGGEPEFRAMQIVAPATAEEKRGFVVLSGEEAADSRVVHEVIGSTRTGIGGVGVEVKVGTREGLPRDGVVRVALPRDGHIFCTWLVTLTGESLIEQAGALSGTKLGQLANVLRLARIE
jgi:mRNA interferase MazF